MYTLKVKSNRGETLTLSNNPLYQVYKIEGLNPPQATVNSSSNATTDGMTVNSVRTGSRNIVLYMTIEGDVEKNRINLYKYFQVKKNVTLYFKNGIRDVFIEGVVELIECDLFANKQIAQISIICPKPYFKSVDYLITEFTTVNSLFSFPFSIAAEGIEFSNINESLRQTIINTGDVESGLIVDIYAKGTVVNPVIYDVINKTSLTINYTLSEADHIIINTNVGEKSVTLLRDGVSSNLLGYMAKGSTWFNLDVGDNVFTFEAESGRENIILTFTTPLLYGGV